MALCRWGLWSCGLRSVVVPLQRPKEMRCCGCKDLAAQSTWEGKMPHAVFASCFTQSSVVPQGTIACAWNCTINSNPPVALTVGHWSWRRRWSLAPPFAVGRKATALHLPNCFSHHVTGHLLPHTCPGCVPTSEGWVGPGIGTGWGCWSCRLWWKQETSPVLLKVGDGLCSCSPSRPDKGHSVRRNEGKQIGWVIELISKQGLKMSLAGVQLPFLQNDCFQCAESCL